MLSTAAQCRYLLSLARPMMSGLEASHLALEPRPGTKTAGWLIGHLAVTGDYGRRLCGRAPICPREWRPAFNPGSQPSIDPRDYPDAEALSRTFERVYLDLCDAVAAVDGDVLAAANPFTPAQPDFPTVGEFVAYLLTGHLAYHMGQLNLWRGAVGLGTHTLPDSDT